MAPRTVGNHLALVDDGHVIPGFQIQLFGCGGDVGVLLPAVLLLAGGEAAIHACVQQCLLGLQGQQTQGGQVAARPGLLEPLDARVGLARVRPAQVQDEVPGEGAGLRVLVLGVQGDEDVQALLDDLGDVPDGVDGPDGTGEQLLGGEVLPRQQTGQIGLRLGLGELVDGLLGRGVEDPGIAHPDVARQGRVFVGAHPASGLDKVGQLAGQGQAVTALLQPQEAAQVARDLGGTQHAPTGGGGQVVEHGPVVMPRQRPGQAVVLLRLRPELCQGLGDGVGGLLGGAAGLALGLGAEVLLLKGLRGLGGLHVLPLPDGHAPAIEMPVAGLGQERVHQGLRPAPAPQLAGGQLLFRPAFSHGGCPPVV